MNDRTCYDEATAETLSQGFLLVGTVDTLGFSLCYQVKTITIQALVMFTYIDNVWNVPVVWNLVSLSLLD
jgi:hypothetical protein